MGIRLVLGASGDVHRLPTGGVNPVLVSMHVTFHITCADMPFDPTSTSLLRSTVNVEKMVFNEKRLFVS